MIVYDGTYRLQPDTERGLKPGSTRICTWRVRIINLTDVQPAVRHLKPTIVIANQTGLATGLISCAEAVGQKISLDFKLDIKKVSSNPGPQHYNNEKHDQQIAHFTSRFMGFKNTVLVTILLIPLQAGA